MHENRKSIMKMLVFLVFSIFSLLLFSSSCFSYEYKFYTSQAESILGKTVQLKDVQKDGSIILSVDSVEYNFDTEKTVGDMWIILLDSHYSDYFTQKWAKLRIDSISNASKPEQIPVVNCSATFGLSYGQSTFVNNKKFTLEDVSSSGFVVINVDGFGKSIENGKNQTFRGFNIYVSSYTYSETPESRSAVFKAECWEGTFKDIVYECGKDLPFITRKAVQIDDRNVTLEDVGARKMALVYVDDKFGLVIGEGIVNGLDITVSSTVLSDQHNLRTAKMNVGCVQYSTTTIQSTTTSTTSTTIQKHGVSVDDAVDVAMNKNLISTYTSIAQATFNGKDAYKIEGKKNVKILGIVPTQIDVGVFIDSNSGEVLKVDKPFWSFLAF